VNAYLDSSVVLRAVLGQRNRLEELEAVDTPVVSALVEVECLRTLDRKRLREPTSPERAAAQREAVIRLLKEARVLDVTATILDRASQPLPSPLGTLDAIHLATAQAWREASDAELVLATHDEALALAGRSLGFRVLGVRSSETSGPDALRLRERASSLRSVRGPAAGTGPGRSGARRRGAARRPPARMGR
jgi:predicted nucleic acid-binding protein